MRQVPTKVHLARIEFAVAYSVHLAVAKPLAGVRERLVNDESALAVLGSADEIEAHEMCAVGPAALKVGRAINGVVERAREMIAGRDQRLDGVAILVGIGL